MPRRPMSDEEMARARENLARARAAKASRQTAAVAEAPAPQTDEPTSEGILAELAGLFQQAAGQKAGRDKAIEDALEKLGSLDPLKYPEIADNATVQAFVERVQAARAQSTDVPPGTILGSGLAAFKKPWTWPDLNKSINLTEGEVAERAKRGEIIFPWVIYTPMTTRLVIWNGLKVYFRARQRVKVCKVFVDTYEEAINQEEFAERHMAWLFNKPGAPTHPDFFTTNAPRVKAMDESQGDYVRVGAGAIDLTPSRDLIELSGGGGDEEEAA